MTIATKNLKAALCAEVSGIDVAPRHAPQPDQGQRTHRLMGAR